MTREVRQTHDGRGDAVGDPVMGSWQVSIDDCRADYSEWEHYTLACTWLAGPPHDTEMSGQEIWRREKTVTADGGLVGDAGVRLVELLGGAGAGAAAGRGDRDAAHGDRGRGLSCGLYGNGRADAHGDGARHALALGCAADPAGHPRQLDRGRDGVHSGSKTADPRATSSRREVRRARGPRVPATVQLRDSRGLPATAAARTAPATVPARGRAWVRAAGGGDGGGCFLTEAVVGARGIEADDGPTLTALRSFRDGYMQRTPERRALVARYYEIAPRIVAAIPRGHGDWAWIGVQVEEGGGGDPHRRERSCLRNLRRHGAPPQGALARAGAGGVVPGSSPVMRARRSMLGLAAAALMAAGAGEAGAQSGPANYSSHDAAFFSELLADRVWVLERPNSAHAGDRSLVWGIHHVADGTARACIHLDGAWQARTGRWRVVSSPRFRALYNYQDAGTESDPGHVKGHVPIFYDPETGRLHSESVGESAWFVLSLGWVQESWPQALKQACPDLDLHAGLPVNAKQTSALMEEAVAQDADANVRAHPGSHLRAPGSTGLAMAGGKSTVRAAELARFLAVNDGHVLESPAGVPLVLALGAERDELWRLDEDGHVADTAVLMPAADGAGIVAQWERLPRRLEYRLGEPFPLQPTGERYGAMALTDRLIAASRAVALPLGETGDISLRFHEGGAVTAEDIHGGELSGRWRWSRGHLHVSLDGMAETVAWSWRDLARHVGAFPDAPGGAGAAE